MRTTSIIERGCSSFLPLLNLFQECERTTMFGVKPVIDPATGEQKRNDVGDPVYAVDADIWHRPKKELVRKTVTVEVPFRGDLEGRIRAHVESHRDWPSVAFDSVRVDRELEPSPGNPYPAPVFAADWLHGEVVYEEQGWYGQLMRELGLEVGHGEG